MPIPDPREVERLIWGVAGRLIWTVLKFGLMVGLMVVGFSILLLWLA